MELTNCDSSKVDPTKIRIRWLKCNESLPLSAFLSSIHLYGTLLLGYATTYQPPPFVRDFKAFGGFESPASPLFQLLCFSVVDIIETSADLGPILL
jgi:hypothetical protein